MIDDPAIFKQIWGVKKKKKLQFFIKKTKNLSHEIAKFSLFRSKIFMFDEMTDQNALKLAIFLEYENPCRFFCFPF